MGKNISFISVWRIHTGAISAILMKVMRKFLILMRLQQEVLKTKQQNYSDLITVSGEQKTFKTMLSDARLSKTLIKAVSVV